MTKKVLALLLSVLMLIGMFPMSAAAATAPAALDIATLASEGKFSNDTGEYVLQDHLEIASNILISSGSVVINLNGKTLTLKQTGSTTDESGVAAIKVDSGATLEIKDSVGGGKITRADGRQYYVVENNGSTTLTSGTIELPATESSAIINRSATGGQAATLTVDGGSVNSSYIAIKNDRKDNTCQEPVLTINDGSFVGTGGDQVIQNWGKATITDGKFHGCVATWSDGNVEVGNTTISGGSFDLTGSKITPQAVLALFVKKDSPNGAKLQVTEGANITVSTSGIDTPVVAYVTYEGGYANKTVQETVPDGSTLEIASGSFSGPVMPGYLAEDLQYEAKSKTGDTPYSYHKTLSDATAAASNGGEVALVAGDKAEVTDRVYGLQAKGADAKFTTTTKLENGIYEVEVSGTAKPSNSGEAPGTDYWFGVGFDRPSDDYTEVWYYTGSTDGTYTAEAEFTKNSSEAGNFDLFDIGGTKTGHGYAFWGSANLDEADGIYRVLKWVKADGSALYEVYHITWNVEKEGIVLKMAEVGFEATESGAKSTVGSKFNGVNGGTLNPNDAVANTLWATFTLTGDVKGTETITATITNTTTNVTYTETITPSAGSKGGIVYISFEPTHQGGKKFTTGNVGGVYSITAEIDGVADDPKTIDIYEVVAVNGDEKTATFSTDASSLNTEPAALEDTETEEFTGWSAAEKSNADHTATYTAQWEPIENDGCQCPECKDDPECTCGATCDGECADCPVCNPVVPPCDCENCRGGEGCNCDENCAGDGTCECPSCQPLRGDPAEETWVYGISPNGQPTDPRPTVTVTADDDEADKYDVVISDYEVSPTKGGAPNSAYWIGVGIVAPEGYELDGDAEEFWAVDGQSQEVAEGYTLWIAYDPENPTKSVTKTIVWVDEAGNEVTETYTFTFGANITTSGVLVTLSEVGFAATAAQAEDDIDAALADINPTLNWKAQGIADNTIWATFKLDGSDTDKIQVNVTFKKGDTTKYTEEITPSTSTSKGGVALISFEPTHAGDIFDPVEGEYTITVEIVDGVADAPQTIKIYKVTVDANGGTWGEDVEVPADYYTAKPDSTVQPTVQPEAPEGKTFDKWEPITDEAAYTITYKAQWKSNSTGGTTIIPDDDGDETEAPAYNNCPKDGTCPVADFTDTDPTAWYHNAVHFVLDNGLMSGNGNGTFTPDSTLTRAMLVQILYNLEGKPADIGPVSFTDVDATDWYSDAVRWAASHGVVAGNGDGTFSPEASITREQVAVIFRNYVKNYLGKSVTMAERTDISKYTDAGKASRWAVDALKWAVGTGLISGTSSTTLEPTAKSTRAQAASILMKYCENIA